MSYMEKAGEQSGQRGKALFVKCSAKEAPTSDSDIDCSESLTTNPLILKGKMQVHTQNSLLEEIKIKWNYFIKMKKRNYLDDYKVVKVIGKGGFGVVSKVQAKYTGYCRAAKKIMKASLNLTDEAKLFQEMAIMMKLDHKNIAKLYEVYDYKSHFVLILELCQGGELLTKVADGSLKEGDSAFVMKQILEALIYLHSQGIVHRDLKPENMLFQKKKNILKIIDFGLAVKKLPGSPPLTDRIGTPYYIAPEVLRKSYDEKCDVWAAGVILFMMITHEPPFRGASSQEIMDNIWETHPNYHKHSFSPLCLNFIQTLLQKDPSKRCSAEQAYKHAWFSSVETTQLDETETKKEEIKMMSKLKSFKFFNKFEAVVYTFIVSQVLKQSQKESLYKIFSKIDLNHNGVISKAELTEALSKENISKERVAFLIRVIDTNRSGQIDLTEFGVASLDWESLNYHHFEQAFAYFDIDHSGVITYDQISAFLQDSAGGEEDIKKIFLEIDENGDGEISKEEFINIFLKRLKIKIGSFQKK